MNAQSVLLLPGIYFQHIYMEFRKMVMITLYAKQKKRHRFRTDFWTLWEKARVGCFERTASKHEYYLR